MGRGHIIRKQAEARRKARNTRAWYKARPKKPPMLLSAAAHPRNLKFYKPTVPPEQLPDPATFTLFDGNYEKRVYWARLPNGGHVKVWPNAGFLFALDGSGKQLAPEDNVYIAPAEWGDE